MRPLLILALLALAACGADGEPIRPEASSTVTLSNKGVGMSTAVRVRQGPFTLGVAL
ncbi:hypothetical protein [Citreimonas salinaria]|uniref:Argininosuccinate lyase n=1 Tax=Citreimonas salinaria TaxID=321339 RepID=A0A1H3F6D2_9RHOB|nr:hypothetical protein [Citreimonas salinaria]SDX86542.1 hypothetical protein SAMN05444340_101225 [Citreimonas salinaria]